MSSANLSKLESVVSKNKPLTERVSDQIIKLIQNRKLQVGEKLPNEFEMAKQLNVGRGTIREAIKILVSRNVVEIRRGCGTFVCKHPGKIDDPLGLSFVQDKHKLALDLCEVRMIIEPEIAALSAQRASDEDILVIEKAAKEVEKLCAKGLRHMDKDIKFHELIAKSTNNLVMPNIIPVIQSSISLFIDVTDSQLTAMTVKTHQMILDAIKEHDSEKARKAMILHLQNNKDKIKIIAGIS